ncbi:MAG: hypothetical protein ACUVXJ_09895 [Phycisphaerae bacterium]
MKRVWLRAAASTILLFVTVMCAAPGKPRGGRTANNEQCLECHPTFRNETIAKTHEQIGTLCVDCHGPSKAHAVDAKEKARPDIVFSRDQVDAHCGQCHDPAHHPQRKAKRFLEQYEGHPGPNGRIITSGSICTDCHGRHIMPRPQSSPAGS